MRDKLIHGYSGVDLGAVWDTAIKNTPSLKVKLQEILKRGGKEMNGVCNSPLRFGATALGRQGEMWLAHACLNFAKRNFTYPLNVR